MSKYDTARYKFDPMDHVGLVKVISRKYRRCWNHIADQEDYIQNGMIGVMRAAEKYEPERGFKVSTYLGWWARSMMFDVVQNESRTIRIPARAQEKMRANGVSLPCKTVSLDQPNFASGESDKDTNVLANRVPDEAKSAEDVLIEHGENQVLHETMMRVLSEREAFVLRERFFHGKNLREVGELLASERSPNGISRERVRQIEAIALSKLRKEMRENVD